MIGTSRTQDVTRAQLVTMMVGRELKALEPRPQKPGAVVLETVDLHATGDRGTEALRSVETAEPASALQPAAQNH